MENLPFNDLKQILKNIPDDLKTDKIKLIIQRVDVVSNKAVKYDPGFKLFDYYITIFKVDKTDTLLNRESLLYDLDNTGGKYKNSVCPKWYTENDKLRYRIYVKR